MMKGTKKKELVRDIRVDFKDSKDAAKMQITKK